MMWLIKSRYLEKEEMETNTVELTHYSLGFAFETFEGLVSDLTPEQAHWMPPGNAIPIGSLYWHIIKYVDHIVHDWGMGQPSLRQREGWQEKVVITSPPPEPDDPMLDLRAIREGVSVDLPALHDYARATAQAVLDWVASLTAEDLADRMIETRYGTFNLSQMLDSLIIWHINAHCGEISALKGCQSLKGYPW
jgi:hypothetical protein